MIAGVAADWLRSIIERVERLQEDRKALDAGIKGILSEAKSAGFDVTVIRQIIRLRKMGLAEVAEPDILLDVYRRALWIRDGKRDDAQPVPRTTARICFHTGDTGGMRRHILIRFRAIKRVDRPDDLTR